MRLTYFLFPAMLGLSACNTTKIMVPANDRVAMDYDMQDGFTTALWNRSGNEVDITVLNKTDGHQVSGFGLNAKGEATITVDANCHLVITNNNDKPAKIRFRTSEAQPQAEKASAEVIRFTLANTSGESIPLIIPSVMNPNLSPYSESGVDLAIGQEILYKSGTKKYVLLVVDSSIQNGAVIDMAHVLREKKAELGIQ